MLVDRIHDLVGACGPVTARTLGCICRTRLPARARLGAQAAGHDDLAVVRQRFADGVETSLTASSMKPQVFTITRSAPSKVGGVVALGAKLGEDVFRIDQRLGTAQRHEAQRAARHCASALWLPWSRSVSGSRVVIGTASGCQSGRQRLIRTVFRTHKKTRRRARLLQRFALFSPFSRLSGSGFRSRSEVRERKDS